MPFAAADSYAQTVMDWADRPLPSGVRSQMGVAYGEHPLHRYDVYSPAQGDGLATLVFWHGGGWTNGYRDYVRFMAEHVTRLGLVLVAPSYRLVWQAKFPAALQDCKAALKHFILHATSHGAAQDKLILSGHSAGGHLATLTALQSAALDPTGVIAKAVRVCMPISAIMDLHHPAPASGSLEERVYTSVLARPEDDASMSPLCWAAGNCLPFILCCGERDSPRVLSSNQRMAALLAWQKGAVQLHVESGADHFSTHTNLDNPAHAWYAHLRRTAQAI